VVYLLDTNVAIHIRDQDPATLARFEELEGPVLLSTIVRVELENGLYREPSLAGDRRLRLIALFENMELVPFDSDCADAYAAIVAACGYSRRKLLDRMIAAQAVASKATLITMNPSDFQDVPALSILAW